ncbi:hypothetical protein VNO77_27699 [Canavalia gladiata]|uniref:Uncharacterized protein n=1 Tax=Canavalia gladiata TaxID=3824 RepID=A0AAN9KZC1_CANGL
MRYSDGRKESLGIHRTHGISKSRSPMQSEEQSYLPHMPSPIPILGQPQVLAIYVTKEQLSPSLGGNYAVLFYASSELRLGRPAVLIRVRHMTYCTQKITRIWLINNI